MLLRMFGEIKVSSDWFRYVFYRLSLCHEGFLGIDRSPTRLPVSPMYNFSQRVRTSYAVNDIGEVQVK